MNCPRCGLINPDTAIRCDCGYNFQTSVVEMSANPQQIRKRGGCLTAYLTFNFIYFFLGFYVEYSITRYWDLDSLSIQLLVIARFAVLVLSTLLLLAVWKWKRWAVFGYIALYVASALGFGAMNSLSFELIKNLALSAVELLVFILLVRRVWDWFDPSPTTAKLEQILRPLSRS